MHEEGTEILSTFLSLHFILVPMQLFYLKYVYVSVLTVGFDMQSGADECKERGVEHDCAVAVERHVHRHQPLL